MWYGHVLALAQVDQFFLLKQPWSKKSTNLRQLIPPSIYMVSWGNPTLAKVLKNSIFLPLNSSCTDYPSL